MVTATLIKQNISLELAYNFKGLVHFHHGGEHGSTQADMVLEKYFESSTSESVGSRKRKTLGLARAFETLKPTLRNSSSNKLAPPPTMPHLLIPPNSATPW